jgi:hypothetical protein
MNSTNENTRSGTERRKRQPRIYSRVSEAELNQIESAAAAHGMSVGGYLRWLAIDRPETRTVRRPLADVRLLTQLKGQVGRIGGNIHQLIRLANRGEIPGAADLHAAAQEVTEFLATARDLLRRAE